MFTFESKFTLEEIAHLSRDFHEKPPVPQNYGVKLADGVTGIVLHYQQKNIEVPLELCNDLLVKHLVNKLEVDEKSQAEDSLGRSVGRGAFKEPDGSLTFLPVRIDKEANDIRFQAYHEREINEKNYVYEGEKLLQRARDDEYGHITSKIDDFGSAAKSFSQALTHETLNGDVGKMLQESVRGMLQQNVRSNHADYDNEFVKHDSRWRSLQTQISNTQAVMKNISPYQEHSWVREMHAQLDSGLQTFHETENFFRDPIDPEELRQAKLQRERHFFERWEKNANRADWVNRRAFHRVWNLFSEHNMTLGTISRQFVDDVLLQNFPTDDPPRKHTEFMRKFFNDAADQNLMDSRMRIYARRKFNNPSETEVLRPLVEGIHVGICTDRFFLDHAARMQSLKGGTILLGKALEKQGKPLDEEHLPNIDETFIRTMYEQDPSLKRRQGEAMQRVFEFARKAGYVGGDKAREIHQLLDGHILAREGEPAPQASRDPRREPSRGASFRGSSGRGSYRGFRGRGG